MCVCSSPPSHFLCPPPFPFGNHKALCYVLRLFLFGKEFHLHPFLEPTSKKYHMILVFLCLTLLSVIISTSFLVAGPGSMSPFLWLSCSCSVCEYPALFTHPSLLTHLGFIRVLALVHSAAMNDGVHLSFKIMVFSGSVPKTWDCWLWWYFAL